MGSSGFLKLFIVVLVSMVVAAPYADAAISCGTVVSSLSPCIAYLRSGGAPPAGCCNGVKSLNSAAKTTPDRQAVCGCLKSASGGISGLKPALMTGLPSKCGVNIPYKISPSTDCSKATAGTVVDSYSPTRILDARLILLRFESESDYLAVWLKDACYVTGKLVRFIKWTPFFQAGSEPSVVPIWLNFPGLPINLFNLKDLKAIGSIVGKVLLIDGSIRGISRPSLACICVEMDVSKEKLERFWLGLSYSSRWQKKDRKANRDANSIPVILDDRGEIREVDEDKERESNTMGGVAAVEIQEWNEYNSEEFVECTKSISSSDEAMSINE
ncbi:hypothetical protein HHK36_010578 [Tetracentron sinense]|uniref:Non-specific lipid-transfer protein n=1 Tax=Tetracentron sinense TaxID=13715 RepID=A0A835DGG4_TETSI|nr:hypothetical protein HHK36_010578 [Tetracentron sinense]